MAKPIEEKRVTLTNARYYYIPTRHPAINALNDFPSNLYTAVIYKDGCAVSSVKEPKSAGDILEDALEFVKQDQEKEVG